MQRVLRIPELLSLRMANLVLASSNYAAFTSSTWTAWASAPHDLLLVTEVSIEVGFALIEISQGWKCWSPLRDPFTTL